MSLPLSMPAREDAKRSSHASQSSKDSSSSHDKHKQAAKAANGQAFLGLPLESSFRPSIESLSDSSTHSVDQNESLSGRRLTHGRARLHSRSPGLDRNWRQKVDGFWAKNKGLMLVILAQLFGALMSVTTRLLETDGSHGHGMHPFQVNAFTLCMVVRHLLSPAPRFFLLE